MIILDMMSIINILLILISSSVANFNTPNRSVIRGAFESLKDCSKKDFQVFLSQDKKLLHQISVPPNGNFAIDVVPGKYTVVAKNQDQCHFRQDLQVAQNTNQYIIIKPVISQRKVAGDLASMCSCIQAPCNCESVLSKIQYPFPPYIQPSMSPWWLYQAPFYPNYFYPGQWMNFGLNSGYYPGQGHVGLAKPNVYFHGPKGTKFKMQIQMIDNQANWLATVPDYDLGWSGKIAEGNKIEIGKPHYSFLYYDLRTDEKPFQSKSGFCSNRAESLKKMSEVLKNQGFSSQEIFDFEEYWQIKMPPKDVCVFPQTENELDRIVKLEIRPHPDHIRRMVFVVVYQDSTKTKYKGKFLTKPTQNWVSLKSERAPSSKNSNLLEIHEWGVAFLFEPEN